MDLDGNGDGRDTNDIAVLNAALGSTIGTATGAIYNSDCEFNYNGHLPVCDRREPDSTAALSKQKINWNGTSQ